MLPDSTTTSNTPVTTKTAMTIVPDTGTTSTSTQINSTSMDVTTRSDTANGTMAIQLGATNLMVHVKYCTLIVVVDSLLKNVPVPYGYKAVLEGGCISFS